jgi:pimeloyl-ACP methyl ester carboxylesterase
MKEQNEKFKLLMKLTEKIGRVFAERMIRAQKSCIEKTAGPVFQNPAFKGKYPLDVVGDFSSYLTDSLQRSLLFWDTIRGRGNNFIEHERAGKPPVLVYEYEKILDGRKFKRPVNYVLLKITPPEGCVTDNAKRPFIIIDPRAGHGPGIGGFKKDSEIGVALKAGHPVYFISFLPEPVEGQTIPDVCGAQVQFVQAVRDLHPDSPKPVIYGNCQGGWATMMVAATRPELVGAVVINGSPLSYWSGSWSGGAGENPMRYSGGLLGGTWTALLASDLGNGKFDGAYLVENFENLNLANTYWDKYYNLYDKIDTEPPRFLEFEKWWHGFYFMNEEEIRWIVDNLFIGNRLARGEIKYSRGNYFDLKSIRSPIIVFSSKGDNITPPQQAINWIADVYESNAEIKANEQTIFGLVEEEVGHLGIFVSGRVAKKEHSQIVEVLNYIERARPGLYIMKIQETKDEGAERYEVTFEERKLEDLRKVNRYERRDEKPFEIVEAVSRINENAYNVFARPVVRSFVNETTAEMIRMFNPMRFQCWAFSSLNPLMMPVHILARMAKERRKPAPQDNFYRSLEKSGSVLMSAYLDLARDIRDAVSESLFYMSYGGLAVIGASEPGAGEYTETKVNPRELPFVREALSAIDKGGYPEFVARVVALIGKSAGVIPFKRLEYFDEMVSSDEILSKLSADEFRRIMSEQAVIADFEPERAFEALPNLVADAKNKARALSVLEAIKSRSVLNAQQTAILDKIDSHIRLSSKAGMGTSSGKGKLSIKKRLVGKPGNPKRRETISRIH